MQIHLVNSRTFKDLWNEIQGLSNSCPVCKYFQGLEFRGGGEFEYFQRLLRMRGNPDYNYKLQTTITNDVTKLVKIWIRRMQILTFKIHRMQIWMRIEAFVLSVRM